jgi:hypothetical protein
VVAMKIRLWKDLVKDVSARPETVAIKRDFGKFTDDMKRLMRGKPSDVARIDERIGDFA